MKSINLVSFSLFMVGLMWVFPFLHYVHQYPITTFYQEWWSAFLGLLALLPLASRDFWQRPELPRIVMLPTGLIALLMLQMTLGKIAYFNQALLYALYLLFAILLMLLGAYLRNRFGMQKLAVALAFFLLTGAEISSLIGLLQQFRLHTPLDYVIAMKTSYGVFGNLAQPNHFADYIAMGLASLGLLFQQKKLKTPYVIALAIPLLLVMTLSGSRSSWLYLLLMSGMAGGLTRKDFNQLPLLRYCLSLMLGLGLIYLIMELPFMSDSSVASFNTGERLINQESGDIRLYLWRESWLMLLQSPWLGVGFGQFAYHHFELLPSLQQSSIMGLYNNAHNLVFHLAAETGLAGLLILAGTLLLWLKGLFKTTFDAAHWWGYAVLGILAIHSLLEYPLWYAYFLAIASFLLGALDERCYRLELRKLGQLSATLILLMCLVTLVQLLNNYQKLERTLTVRPLTATDTSMGLRMRDGLIELQGNSLLSTYAELFLSSMIVVSPDHIDYKLDLNSRVLRFAPIGLVVYRQSLLLAQVGRLNEAQVMMERSIWSYPGEFAGIQRQLIELTEKDPAHYSALLEFALRKEQEYQRAIRH